MTFEHRIGDLFEQTDLEAIGHGVNCVGAMRSGIAARFSEEFPEMEERYRQLCAKNLLKLGMVWPWFDDELELWVFNLATQFQPGKNAKLEAVEKSVQKALEFCEKKKIASLGLPQIGCGIGGLVWEYEVKPVLEYLATDSKTHLVLVTFDA